MPIPNSGARVADSIPQPAAPISWLSSAGTADGVAAGNIPADWHGGITWTPESCNPSHVWEHKDDYADTNEDGTIDEGPFAGDPVVNPVPFNITNPGTGKCEPQGVSEAESHPFTVYMPNDCPVRPRAESLETAQDARTMRSLESRIGLQMARRLHVGSPHPTDPSPSLQNSATDLTVETTPASGVPQGLCPHAALAALLRAREVNGTGHGVLHIPSVLLPIMIQDRLVVQQGNTYRTVMGWPVAVGGYPTTGPASSFGVGGLFAGASLPAGVVYMYVSGNVEYALGAPGSRNQPTEHAAGEPGWLFDLLRMNRNEKVAEIPGLVRMDPCQVFGQATAMGCDCNNS